MWKAMLRWSKQVVYIYDGDQSKADVEEDPEGDVPVPPQHSIINRKGHVWKVVAVNEESTVSGPKAWPVFRVFLQKIE